MPSVSESLHVKVNEKEAEQTEMPDSASFSLFPLLPAPIKLQQKHRSDNTEKSCQIRSCKPGSQKQGGENDRGDRVKVGQRSGLDRREQGCPEMVDGGAGRRSDQDQPAKSKDHLRGDVDGVSPRADENGEEDSADQHASSHDIFGAVGSHDFSRNQGVGRGGKGADQSEKEGVPGDGKVSGTSAGADEKGPCHGHKNRSRFRFSRQPSHLNTGDDQYDDGGQVLQHRRGSGVGIINGHKKGKLCQTDAENRKKDQRHGIFSGLPDRGMRRGVVVFSAKNQIQKNQNHAGADLPDTENNRRREGEIVQQILSRTAGKSPAEGGDDNGNGSK